MSIDGDDSRAQAFFTARGSVKKRKKRGSVVFLVLDIPARLSEGNRVDWLVDCLIN